jgi:hypothetical protein
MFKLSLRELALFVFGVVVGLVFATYLSTLRAVSAASPNYDSLTTDVKEFPWLDVWHLCHEMDNQEAGLRLYNLSRSTHDDVSDHKLSLTSDFLFREQANETHIKYGGQVQYMLEIWSDGKRIRYAFRRWTPDLTRDDVVRDMDLRLKASIGKP